MPIVPITTMWMQKVRDQGHTRLKIEASFWTFLGQVAFLFNM